jgi:hypothetical protein
MSFNGLENWFEKLLFRKRGNGEDYLFWDDPWLGEDIFLRECFPRIVGLFSYILVFLLGLCIVRGGVSEGWVGARDVSCL